MHVHAVLRRLNSDENQKLDFREFSAALNPVLRGFTQQGCVTPESIIGAPTTTKEKIASNDILAGSKYLKLLDHVGPAFNLE